MPVTIVQRGARAPADRAIYALMQIANRAVQPRPPSDPYDIHALYAVAVMHAIATDALAELGYQKQAANDG